MIYHDSYHHRMYYQIKGKTVCFLKYEIHSNEIHINTLQTAIQYRHRGCASLILIKFLEWAKQQTKNITLLALPFDKTYKDDDLITFYNKFGFTHDDRRFETNYLIYKQQL